MSNQIDCSDDFEVLSPLPISILETNNIPKEFKQHSNWLLWKKEPVMDSKTGKQKVDSTGKKSLLKSLTKLTDKRRLVQNLILGLTLNQ